MSNNHETILQNYTEHEKVEDNFLLIEQANNNYHEEPYLIDKVDFKHQQRQLTLYNKGKKFSNFLKNKLFKPKRTIKKTPSNHSLSSDEEEIIIRNNDLRTMINVLPQQPPWLIELLKNKKKDSKNSLFLTENNYNKYKHRPKTGNNPYFIKDSTSPNNKNYSFNKLEFISFNTNKTKPALKCMGKIRLDEVVNNIENNIITDNKKQQSRKPSSVIKPYIKKNTLDLFEDDIFMHYMESQIEEFESNKKRNNLNFYTNSSLKKGYTQANINNNDDAPLINAKSVPKHNTHRIYSKDTNNAYTSTMISFGTTVLNNKSKTSKKLSRFSKEINKFDLTDMIVTNTTSNNTNNIQSLKFNTKINPNHTFNTIPNILKNTKIAKVKVKIDANKNPVDQKPKIKPRSIVSILNKKNLLLEIDSFKKEKKLFNKEHLKQIEKIKKIINNDI